SAEAVSKLLILLPGEVAAPGTATGKTAAAPTAQTAGTAIASGIVVNAVDANWNVVSTATPNVTISSTDSNATIADDNGVTAGNLTLVAGTRTLSSFTFKTAATRTITATDAAAVLAASTSANVTVNAGAVTKLQILLPGEVAAPGTATGKTAATPTAQTAGTAIASGIVVNAVDANWNVVGSATTDVTISTSDRKTAATPTAQAAGAAIANAVRVNAVDANWNVVGSATPDVTISTSDSNAASADDNGAAAGNLTLVAGTGTLSGFTFKTVGTRTVT